MVYEVKQCDWRDTRTTLLMFNIKQETLKSLKGLNKTKQNIFIVKYCYICIIMYVICSAAKLGWEENNFIHIKE